MKITDEMIEVVAINLAYADGVIFEGLHRSHEEDGQPAYSRRAKYAISAIAPLILEAAAVKCEERERASLKKEYEAQTAYEKTISYSYAMEARDLGLIIRAMKE